MPRKRSNTLTEAELRLMKILWIPDAYQKATVKIYGGSRLVFETPVE